MVEVRCTYIIEGSPADISQPRATGGNGPKLRGPATCDSHTLAEHCVVANKTPTSNPHSENSSSVNPRSKRFVYSLRPIYEDIKITGRLITCDSHACCCYCVFANKTSTSHLEDSLLVNPSERFLSPTNCFWLLRNLSSQNKIAE